MPFFWVRAMHTPPISIYTTRNIHNSIYFSPYFPYTPPPTNIHAHSYIPNLTYQILKVYVRPEQLASIPFNNSPISFLLFNTTNKNNKISKTQTSCLDTYEVIATCSTCTTCTEYLFTNICHMTRSVYGEDINYSTSHLVSLTLISFLSLILHYARQFNHKD